MFGRSKRISALFTLLSGLVLIASFQNCSMSGVSSIGASTGTSSSGDPAASTSADPLNVNAAASGGTTTGNGMVDMRLKVGVPGLYGTSTSLVQNLNVCISRMKFEGTSGQKIDMKLPNSNLSIALNETRIALVNLPDGSYDRIEVIFNGDCLGDAVSFKNTIGSFKTGSSISVKYTGLVTVVNGSAIILFDFASLVSNLRAVDYDYTIAPNMQAQSYLFIDDSANPDPPAPN